MSVIVDTFHLCDFKKKFNNKVSVLCNSQKYRSTAIWLTCKGKDQSFALCGFPLTGLKVDFLKNVCLLNVA